MFRWSDENTNAFEFLEDCGAMISEEDMKLLEENPQTDMKISFNVLVKLVAEINELRDYIDKELSEHTENYYHNRTAGY